MPYATVTLTGQFLTPSGQGIGGTIRIEPSVPWVIDATGNKILVGTVSAKLGDSGAFSIALPATDDVTLSPSGFQYTLHGPTGSITFSLPTTPSTVDVADITPVAPAPVAAANLTDATVKALIDNAGSGVRASLTAVYGPQTGAVVAAGQNGVAVGNTAAANTTALDALHTSALALGLSIVLPTGVINTNALTVKVPMSGAGRGKTILTPTGVITVGADKAALADLTIKTATATAISAANRLEFEMRNVIVDYDASVATAWLALDAYNVDRLRVTGCNFRIGGLQLSLCDDFLVDGNYWDCEYVNTNEPCHISGQSSGQFVNNSIYRTLTDGVDLYSSGEYCVIANNRIVGIKGGAGIECKVTMSDDVNNTSGPGNVLDGTVIANNVLRSFISPSTSTRVGIYATYIDNRAAPVFSVTETNRAVIISGNVLEDFNEADPGGGIVGNWHGIAYTGHNGLITNNVVRNMRTWNASVNLGINLTDSSSANAKSVGVRVAGNLMAGIEGTAGAGIQAGSLDRCQIDGNIVRGDEVNATVTKFGLNIVAGATLNHCSISDNLFECNVSTGFGIRTANSTATLNRCKIQGNVLKDCGIQVNVAQYSLFSDNLMDNATNSQLCTVGTAGTYSIGNVYTGNHFTMSADYALSLVDHDAFVITGNSFKDTTRGVLLNGNTKNGTVTSNISVNQTGGVEFPHFSGVSAADQATTRSGMNVINGALPFPDPGRLITITGVDAKVTGTTTLYTVPTGKTAVITGAVIRCTAATAITVAPALGIGVAAGEDDIFASTALTGLTATTKVWSFGASGLAAPVAAAGVIKLGIDTAATGTSQTIAVDLLGYLV